MPNVGSGIGKTGPAKHRVVVQESQHQTVVKFQSPLPPAEFLEAYSRIAPDAPKQLMDIFMAQATHRMACESVDLKARIRLRLWGQLFGIVFALSALCAGVLVASLGCPVVAGIVFATTIPFCAIVFVLGREPKSVPTSSAEHTHVPSSQA